MDRRAPAPDGSGRPRTAIRRRSREIRAGLVDNPPHDIDAVAAAVERQRRLVPAFRRQAAHALCIDIGRIGHDQVVAPALEPREQIALHEMHAAAQAMHRNVLARHRQRVRRKIGGIDARLRESLRRQNGDAAGPGAQVEHGRDSARLDQCFKQLVVEDFADVRARHNGPLVDVERHAPHVDAMQKIGGGLSRLDALRDQRLYGLALTHRHFAIEQRLDAVRMNLQRLGDNERRLGNRIAGAVGEHHLGFRQPHGGTTNETGHGHARLGTGPVGFGVA